MGLFGFKKKEKKCCACCDTQALQNAGRSKTGGARVKVLGSGCAKCNQLEANTLEALKQLRMDTAIDHVTDFAEIAAYGVMTTPALVLDGSVIAYGKVLTAAEIAALLGKAEVRNGL